MMKKHKMTAREAMAKADADWHAKNMFAHFLLTECSSELGSLSGYLFEDERFSLRKAMKLNPSLVVRA